MLKPIAFSLGVAVIATQLVTSAAAMGQGAGRQVLRHCGGDVARLCGNVLPGGGRIGQCLLDHSERLSPPCAAFFAKAKTVRSVLFACQADAARHCAKIQPGGGRIVFCLNDKRTLLSDACNDALNKAETLLRP